MKILNIKRTVLASLGAIILNGATVSCSDIFDKQPLDKVSDQTFWKNEKDAIMALDSLL